MEEKEFPPNTRAPRPAKDEPKRVEKLVSENAVQRKKPLGRRMRDLFVGEDARSVGSYIFLDVIIPAAKDLIHDIIIQSVERTLFGSASAGRTRRGVQDTRPSGPLGYTSYGRASSQPAQRPAMSRSARAQHDFEEIVLAKRVEAEAVLDKLYSLVSQYQEATVADLYEMVGLDSAFTDTKWGWTSLAGSDVVRVRGGYLLNLPQPIALD